MTTGIWLRLLAAHGFSVSPTRVPLALSLTAAFIECFNGRLRQECLNASQFESIEDARKKIEAWRIDYYQHRPHRLLGNLTPNESTRGGQDGSIVKGAFLQLVPVSY